MKLLNTLLLAVVFVFAAIFASSASAQTKTQKSENQAATPAQPSPQRENLQEYIDLLRTDVRQQKAEVMGAVMALNAQDAAKFWPIYSEYDSELTKLNSQRVETIKEYARDYNDLTDDKADELIKRSESYQKQRNELLAQTYEKMKQALGGLTAARFAMVEHQLLLIIDLQIMSSLPVVGQGS